MYKIIRKLLVIAVLVAAVSSCRDTKPEPEPTLPVTYANLDGVWELVSWKGGPLADGSWCCIVFARWDRTFTIHENLASMYPRTLGGSFTIETDDYGRFVLSGEYDFGAGEWGRKYYVSELKASGTMTWTSTDDPDDVSVYRKLPALPEYTQN